MKTFEIIDSIHHFLSDLTTSLKEKDSQIEGQNARIEALEQRLNNLEAQLADTHERLRAKIEEVNSLRGELGDAQHKVVQLEGDKNSLTSRLEASMAHANNLQARLDEANKRYSEDVTALNSELFQTKRERDALRVDKETSDNSFREASEKISSLEGQMSDLYHQLADSKEALAKSQSDLARFRDIVLSVAVAVEPVVGQTKAPEEDKREDRPTSGDGTSSGMETTGSHTESSGHSDQSEPAPQAAE